MKFPKTPKRIRDGPTCAIAAQVGRLFGRLVASGVGDGHLVDPLVAHVPSKHMTVLFVADLPRRAVRIR